MKFVIVLISLQYFNIVIIVLQMFGCTSQNNGTGTHYLNSYLTWYLQLVNYI